MFPISFQSLRRRMFDRLVLRPSREPIDHGSLERVVLHWGADKHLLEYFVQANHEDDAALDLLVLKFPGTAGRAERTTPFPAQMFPDSPSETWTWNPPGYGGSQGRASLQRMKDASLEFFRHAMDHARVSDSTRIWIVGNSLGCVTALHVATEVTNCDRAGILLRNPPPLTDVVKHVARRYPLGRLIHPVAESLIDEMNATLSASRVELPAVFLQSERDELVLPAMQQKVFDAYAGPKQLVLLEGLSHGGVATEYHEPVIRESVQWLWDQTRGDQ
ncbi:MAG: alpha/beta hydrolase [Pirellulaceae bacterium]|nr:alpha/beta hydrolase [Pirellulaceae bacterium]